MDTDQTLDLENLEAAFEGDRDGIAELLELACSDGRDRIIALDAALSSGDAKTARGLAHAIKGASGNVGAFELAAVAGFVESALSDGSLDVAIEEKPRLADAFARFEHAVVAYRIAS